MCALIELGNQAIEIQSQGRQVALPHLALPVGRCGENHEQIVALACGTLLAHCQSRRDRQSHRDHRVHRLSVRVC